MPFPLANGLGKMASRRARYSRMENDDRCRHCCTFALTLSVLFTFSLCVTTMMMGRPRLWFCVRNVAIFAENVTVCYITIGALEIISGRYNTMSHPLVADCREHSKSQNTFCFCIMTYSLLSCLSDSLAYLVLSLSLLSLLTGIQGGRGGCESWSSRGLWSHQALLDNGFSWLTYTQGNGGIQRHIWRLVMHN